MGITLEGRLYLAPVDPNLKYALDFATGKTLPHHIALNPILILEQEPELGQLNSVSPLLLFQASD